MKQNIRNTGSKGKTYTYWSLQRHTVLWPSLMRHGALASDLYLTQRWWSPPPCLFFISVPTTFLLYFGVGHCAVAYSIIKHDPSLQNHVWNRTQQKFVHRKPKVKIFDSKTPATHFAFSKPPPFHSFIWHLLRLGGVCHNEKTRHANDKPLLRLPSESLHVVSSFRRQTSRPTSG